MIEHQPVQTIDPAGKRQAKPAFFSYEAQHHLSRIEERYRETIRLFWSAGIHPLNEIRILDVGCGDGTMLRQFLQWGATPDNLAGIELRPEPAAYARTLNPNLDIRCGSAVELPWDDEAFDVACLLTVFTSILDPVTRRRVASEITRVLRKGGALLWYDFFYNNPANPSVRGLKSGEIAELFPDFAIRLRRITLAPPIARRIPSGILPVLYPLLSGIPALRTHYLGLLRKH